MSKPLSQKQLDLLAFIRAYIAEHQFSPTLHEMMAACGISSTSVTSYNLDKLEERGYLMRPYIRHRAITLTEQSS